ncbi:MAG: TetR/AcrR family transcriptional regulator [Alistipes sp.]
MKRGATKEDIIRTTQALIVRNGIRAVRVDEIAQALGISKRTLYETFVDKATLINRCLEDISSRQKRRVTNYLRRQTDSPLQKIFWLTNEYIDNLRMVDCTFLTDLRQKLIYVEHFEADMQFWEQAMCSILEAGKETGDILPSTESQKSTRRLMNALYEMRLSDTSSKEQILFCRTMLRGIATQTGIQWIDAK